MKSPPSTSDRSTETHDAAKDAGLHYVVGRTPGLARRRAGSGFVYYDAQRRVVKDRETLQRIRRLAIPPAWEHVWICASPHGHIQATGRDQRGRKQFRYHSRWRESRDEAKYHRTVAFGRVLPRIRRRVSTDLRQPGLGRKKILAAMIRLLETTHIRIGNEEYRRHNHSVGLSTMRNRHVVIKGGVLHFAFLGKGGKRHAIDLADPRLARIVRRIQELPGQELFQYIDESGVLQNVSSTDVNAYLRDIAGEDYSAKDFRTWAGTVLAALELSELKPARNPTDARRNLVTAIERVARQLGNTPAICRRCYIHPQIMDSYLRDSLVTMPMARHGRGNGRLSFKAAEDSVLRFLRRRGLEAANHTRGRPTTR